MTLIPIVLIIGVILATISGERCNALGNREGAVQMYAVAIALAMLTLAYAIAVSR